MTTAVRPDIERLKKDLLLAAATLGAHEVRFIVDTYYELQHYRIKSKNQLRALGELAEPHLLVDWLGEQFDGLEYEMWKTLSKWADNQPICVWSQRITGIGPVIAAGIAAHIDITRAPTVGHIWRFAGLDPTSVWKPKTKRPWNAGLKVICWKAGESFVKFQNHPDDVYGQVYVARKALETERNEAGLFAEQAAQALTLKHYSKDTEAYKAYSQGRLPLAHIHARAKRYAVKLFLAHWHHVAMELQGETPPNPYILTQPSHTHFLAPPYWP